jgi:hypothetical protein
MQKNLMPPKGEKEVQENLIPPKGEQEVQVNLMPPKGEQEVQKTICLLKEIRRCSAGKPYVS